MPKRSDGSREPKEFVGINLRLPTATWLELRRAVEERREQEGGRASMNALINVLIAEYLATRKRARR